MKNKKISTWIAVLCVIFAVLASGVYNTISVGDGPSPVNTIVSESTPTPSPVPLKVPKPLAVPKPLETVKPVKNEPPKEEEIAKTVASSTVFTLPTSGEEVRAYSDQKLVYFPQLSEWRCHLGVDFVPSDSDSVFAVADGKVEKIYVDHLFGTTICIDHGEGLKSFYASLSETTVSEGQEITSGAEIGKMGQTAQIEEGIHLHFFMEKDGKTIHPFGNKQ